MSDKKRWRKETWIEFGAEQLRQHGPSVLTVDGLCAAAGRTKGSFYHHFDTIDSFLIDLARFWRKAETDEVIEEVQQEVDPQARLARLVALTNETDHRLEAGMRALSLGNEAIRSLVLASDGARVGFLGKLLADAYGLEDEKAGHIARLYHALHLAAQFRSPDDIGGFSAGPTELIRAWVRRDAGME